MPIELRCTECQRRLRVRDEIAGKRIKCPSCQAILRVPETAAGPLEPASSHAPAPAVPPPDSDAPAASDAWHLKTADGATYGPVPRRELDTWFQEGRVDASCQVLEAGARSWRWASDVYPQLAPRQPAPAYSHTSPSPAPPSPAPPSHASPNGSASEAFPFAVDTRPGSHARRSTRHSRRAAAPNAGPNAGTEELSDKSKLVAGLLGLFLGVYGVHRFYLGYPGIGIAMLLTLGGCGIWSLIDAILILAGSVRDPYGRPLRD